MGTLKGARYRYITCAKLVKKNKIFVFLTKTMTVLEHFCWSEYIHKSGEICGYTKICGYIKCIPKKKYSNAAMPTVIGAGAKKCGTGAFSFFMRQNNHFKGARGGEAHFFYDEEQEEEEEEEETERLLSLLLSSKHSHTASSSSCCC